MDLTQLTHDLIRAQVQQKNIDYTSIDAWLRTTHTTLIAMWQREFAHPVEPAPIPTHWRRSIGQKAIVCMECGKTFKAITVRHLGKHALNALSYRLKYGMPPNQSLSSRAVTRRRREVVQAVRPWLYAIDARRRQRNG